MKACKCGSYAINHHCHGRDGSDDDLCDVCYWRKRAEQPAQQKPVALKWQQAPVKTQWGDDMVVASVAIDKDHTLSLYCEHDQTTKVDAMFAQRTWVGLSEEDREQHRNDWYSNIHDKEFRAIEAKLKEKNNGN